MKNLSITLFLSIILTPLATSAEEAHPGKELHDESCLNCHKGKHDAAFYSRDTKRFTDYKGLHSMVEACDSRMGTALFPEDMQAITDFLNDSYYKFSKK